MIYIQMKKLALIYPCKFCTLEFPNDALFPWVINREIRICKNCKDDFARANPNIK